MYIVRNICIKESINMHFNLYIDKLITYIFIEAHALNIHNCKCKDIKWINLSLLRANGTNN